MCNKDLTLIIMSCDAFSDLWEGQIKQLRSNWENRPEQIFIVTDKITNKNYKDINIIYPSEDMEWSERLNWALSKVKTEYVFFTLDDYFLIDNVKNDVIESYVEYMKNNKLDYIRLRKRRKKFTVSEIKGMYKLRNLNFESSYAINLYAGIWKKEFMSYCCRYKNNAWQFEVSLNKSGELYGAKCAICMDNDVYPILDVVRKGKLLRNAAKYFRKHPGLYLGDRETNDFIYELKLNIKELGVSYAPEWLVEKVRNFMIKKGHHYFSQDS